MALNKNQIVSRIFVFWRSFKSGNKNVHFRGFAFRAWIVLLLRKLCFSRTSNKILSACKFFIVRIMVLVMISAFILNAAVAHNSNGRASNENEDSHPKTEFSNYFKIQPEIYHGRHKRALANTLEGDGLHAVHITLHYRLKGGNVIADLQLNENLIPQGHFLRYQKSSEGSIMQKLNKTDINLCHYQGTIRGIGGSYVAISTCNGINGIVFDGAETYYIYSGSEELYGDHYIFRNSDILHNATCGFENNSSRKNEAYNIRDDRAMNRILRYKRSKAEDVIRGPYNANRHSSYVELVIVVDNKVYKSFGENLKKVHNHCKDIANIVNALYVPLNIFIALVGVVVWNESNEIELSSDGDDTLTKFLQYRRNSLVQNHPNDNAQLLTKEQFEGGVVGKALKGPICTYEFSGGVSMEHSQIVAVVATTVAHEMGHNFGMEHDTNDCRCVEEKCIMSASSTSVVPRHWSSCSIDQLNVAFSHGMNYCLRNKPLKLFESPQCGNGFVELGEQCDCGLPEFCENSCCDPNTCMLNANASCATGECCDLMTCRPKTPGTECRSAEEECDLPEYCTGESEYCPSDVYKRDTEECDNSNAYCYKGSCRSRSNQCKILWGPSGESSDHCYEKNTDGSRHGNCGYDRLSSKFIPCLDGDVHCGMLHCKHLNERLEFGMESVAILASSFMNHEGSIIPCRTALVDFGLQSPDPGLTPNGAKCGDEMMCVNQSCLSINILRSNGLGMECPNDCNGQGICNSAGHCHCYLGFSPPDCTNPGQGGSLDSGPAANPNGRIGFTRAMYIFFLGVVPTVAIVLVLTYYWRQNHPLQLRQSPNVTKLSTKSSPSLAGAPMSTPSSTDDMNCALLRSTADIDTSKLNNTMFGKFKGFTLKPLPSASSIMHLVGPNVAFVHPVAKPFEEQPNEIPMRSAPPIPHANAEIFKRDFPLSNHVDKLKLAAPALPPPNPGFNARPIISNPVLETSTCTAKELVSPLKEASAILPVRAAPVVPTQSLEKKRERKILLNSKNSTKQRDGTIKKIASLLKREDKMDTNSSLKHAPKLKLTIDREKLKNIKISAPISVVDSIDDGDRIHLARTQSMRDPSSIEKKTIVQSFSSMRQSSTVNRPKSVFGMRPKSPPPRPPAPIAQQEYISKANAVFSDTDQHSTNNDYDDCKDMERVCKVNSSNESDNIYSVIDESSPSLSHNTKLLSTTSRCDDSMGLLGEIVHEIELLNVDSIYSASTLKNRKSSVDVGQYIPEVNENNEYIKSNDSTTSSGYLRPSAINTPVARVAPNQANNTNATCSSLGSFKPKSSGKLEGSSAIRTKVSTNISTKTKFHADAMRKRSSSPNCSNSSSKPISSHKNDVKKATKLNNPKTSKPTIFNKPQSIIRSGILENNVSKVNSPNSISDKKWLSNTNKRTKLVNSDKTLPTSSFNENEPCRTQSASQNPFVINSRNSTLNSSRPHAVEKQTSVALLQQRFEIGEYNETTTTTSSPLNSSTSLPNGKT